MATVKYILNHPFEKGTKTLRKDEVSVDLRLTIDRNNRIKISTGLRIKPGQWSFTEKCAKSNHDNHQKFNIRLGEIRKAALNLWMENHDKTTDELRQLLPPIVRGKSSTSEKKTLFTALEAFLNQYKSEKEEKTLGKYKTLQTRLTEFSKSYPVDFETLDFNFYDAFKKYLYAIPNPNYAGHSLYRSDDGDCFLLRNDSDGSRVGLFDDTVYKYFINLKTFLSWVEKRGHKVHPSYKTWEILKKKHQPISLTFEELERLETTPMPSKALDIARDYLVFECRTGQRISDIKAFNRADYEDYKWTHNPKKGNRISSKTVTVHFKGYCANALLILQKYNFKMPQISEQKLNENIKKACKEAKIDQEIYTDRWAGNKKVRITGKKYEFISTHTGRKTFITLALQSGMPIEVVMSLTGISEYQTIQHYRADFEDNVVEKYLTSIEENRTLMKKSS